MTVRLPSRVSLRRPWCVRWHLLLLLLSFALPLAACGKKGPPLPPLRIAPARIEDLTIAKAGNEVRAEFTIPSFNEDKSTPADIVAVEVYAISGKPVDPFGQSLSGPDFLKFAELVGRLEVEPVPDPDAPPPPPGTPPDPRPAQGERAVITETLTAEDFEPWVHPRLRRVAQQTAEETEDEETAVVVRPLGPAPVEDLFSRTYVAVGVSRRGTRGALSNRVGVPLIDPPGVPQNVRFEHTETMGRILFDPPPNARRLVQEPTPPGALEARSLAPGAAPTTYNAYRVIRSADGSETVSPTPVNAEPSVYAAVADLTIVLGEERCYQVRALQVFGRARVESEPTPTACHTFTDIFPPAAPTGLSAVGSEGGISLIWEPNTEPDLGGYLVLRGEVQPDGTAGPLAPIVSEPLKETTYRDTAVKPGVRYVYAVVAVDNASPRNQSPESNRVEEGAR